MTGIFAAFTCFRIGSQPSSTMGARMMASTLCAMNAPSALIWFSCCCCASENLRFTPRLAASFRTDAVSAVRQALSAPIWEKPTAMIFFALSFERDEPVDSEDSRLHAVRSSAPANTAETARISLRIDLLPGRFYQQIGLGATDPKISRAAAQIFNPLYRQFSVSKPSARLKRSGLQIRDT